jgi:gamma-glutamylcyclotransferase (GGCT)/AIG2-like uncharacterized protein YtfP
MDPEPDDWAERRRAQVWGRAIPRGLGSCYTRAVSGAATVKLFVYGSLLAGEAAHARLRGARLIARARTGPHFTLVDMGEYPALVDGGYTAVAGEIYAVDETTLLELDAYEEAPDVYARRTLIVEGHDVVTYVLAGRLAVGRPGIASGDWRRR